MSSELSPQAAGVLHFLASSKTLQSEADIESNLALTLDQIQNALAVLLDRHLIADVNGKYQEIFPTGQYSYADALAEVKAATGEAADPLDTR